MNEEFNMDKEALYNMIDRDDEMTEEEKRQAYFAEIDSQESELDGGFE